MESFLLSADIGLELLVAGIKLGVLVVGGLNIEFLPVPSVHDFLGESLAFDVTRSCLTVSVDLKRVL